MTLAAALACVLVWLGASTASMSSMTGMSDGSPVSTVAAASTLTTAAADTVSGLGPAVASMCDSACIVETSACALGVGLAVTTVLALLLGSRRDTFLGLLARLRTTGTRRPRWLMSPWTVLSLSSLGVLRV